MLDSYNWSDLQPNQFHTQELKPKGTMRVPYKPYKEMPDGVYEYPSIIVDIYVEDEIKRSDNGAQAEWYSNGALTDCDDHFGIKTFGTFHEAYCAYNRQYMAAVEGMAPPVGRMVLLTHVAKGNRIRISSISMGESTTRKYVWGYQTCVAEMDEDCDFDSAERREEAEDAFDEHIGDRRCEVDIPSCFAVDPDEFDICSDYKGDWITEYLQEQYPDPDETPKHVIEAHSWAYSYDEMFSEAELKWALAQSDLVVTQRDKIRTVADIKDQVRRDWNPMWGVALVNHLRTKEDCGIHKAGKMLMAEPLGDLHTLNVGRWCGDPVTIDWGYHILGGGQNSATSFDCDPVPNMDWHFSQYAGNVNQVTDKVLH